MVSWRALTAAPLEPAPLATSPRPVLAIAFVNAFRTELLAPAAEAAASVPVAAFAPATLTVPPALVLVLALALVPVPVPALVLLVLPEEVAALMPALPLPPI